MSASVATRERSLIKFVKVSIVKVFNVNNYSVQMFTYILPHKEGMEWERAHMYI